MVGGGWRVRAAPSARGRFYSNASLENTGRVLTFVFPVPSMAGARLGAEQRRERAPAIDVSLGLVPVIVAPLIPTGNVKPVQAEVRRRAAARPSCPPVDAIIEYSHPPIISFDKSGDYE